MSDSRQRQDNHPLIHAKKIVVIGDGPFALAQAIALKNKGLDVSIVGLRLGNYTRSGNYVRGLVITAVNFLIAPAKIKETTSRHLKDLENQLYGLVQTLDIPLYKEEFTRFIDHKTIEKTDRETGTKTLLPADLIYDCTGTSRSCLKKINEVHEHTFTFEPILGNPYKSYAQVRVIMTNEEYDIFKRMADPTFKPNPIVYALVMEELRELGWKHFAIPRCYGNKFPKKIPDTREYTVDKNLVKVNIYTQIPEGMMHREDIEKFVKTILKIARNNANDLSLPELTIHQEAKLESKRKDKPMITAINVSPVKTTPALYVGDPSIPPTLHIGDATLNMPFYSGTSLVRGVFRTMDLNKALMIQKGVLMINEKQYEEAFKAIITSQSDFIIEELFSMESSRLTKGNQSAITYYKDAYEKCTHPDNRRKIVNGLTRLGIFSEPTQAPVELEHLRQQICNLIPQEERNEICHTINEHIEQTPWVYIDVKSALTQLIQLIPKEFNIIKASVKDILDDFLSSKAFPQWYFFSHDLAKEMLCSVLILGEYKNMSIIRCLALNLIASMRLKNEMQSYLHDFLHGQQHALDR